MLAGILHLTASLSFDLDQPTPLPTRGWPARAPQAPPGLQVAADVDATLQR